MKREGNVIDILARRVSASAFSDASKSRLLQGARDFLQYLKYPLLLPLLSGLQIALATTFEGTMPPARKRNNVAVARTSSNSTVVRQRGIQGFGKISKPPTHNQTLGKRKAIDTGFDAQEPSEGTRKRSCTSIEKVTFKKAPANTPVVIPGQSLRSGEACVVTAAPIERHVKQATPRKRAALRNASITPVETPTKGARSILESFSLNSSSPSTRSSSPLFSRQNSRSTSLSRRSSSPVCEGKEELPDELQELVELHSSFLSALSLYYAHHDCLAPVDLRFLTPSVSKIWRKRNVRLEDIQRILGTAQFAHSSKRPSTQGVGAFTLVDYGHGKTCLEVDDDFGSAGIHRKPIDEQSLKILFVQNLQQQWQQSKVLKSISASMEAFVASLPLLSIQPCDSLSKLAPLLAKGKRRLEDLKAGAVKAQKSSSVLGPTAKDISRPHPKPVAARSDSLLSRIRAKELIQARLPAALSPVVLARKSALQRIEEVVPVVALLVGGCSRGGNKRLSGSVKLKQQKQTQSFTMPTLVQHLQMSLRNPISKEDAVKCVRLLADLAPEWVGLKEVGSCTGITVRMDGAVGREDMRKRVERMLRDCH